MIISTIVTMKQTGVFIVSEPNCSGGAILADKCSAIGARYIGWWATPGHRQCTIVLQVYEKHSNSN